MSEQLNRIESLLVSFIEQTTGKFEQIDSRFERIDSRFEQMDSRFEQMDLRFEQMDSRFEQIDSKFDKVDARFDAVQSQLNRMEQAQQDDLVAVLQITNSKLEEVKGLAEHTLKEQAMLRYDLERLKPSLMSPSNKLLMNDLD